jgi:hypothetical protein
MTESQETNMRKLSELYSDLKLILGETCPHCGQAYSFTLTTEGDTARIGLVHQCTEARYDKHIESTPMQAALIENDLAQN